MWLIFNIIYNLLFLSLGACLVRISGGVCFVCCARTFELEMLTFYNTLIIYILIRRDYVSCRFTFIHSNELLELFKNFIAIYYMFYGYTLHKNHSQRKKTHGFYSFFSFRDEKKRIWYLVARFWFFFGTAQKVQFYENRQFRRSVHENHDTIVRIHEKNLCTDKATNRKIMILWFPFRSHGSRLIDQPKGNSFTLCHEKKEIRDNKNHFFKRRNIAH